MAIKKYYDTDCNLGMLDGKTVAVIGFGSQGHAHSENLAESGVNVVVGLRKGSAHWEKAAAFAADHANFQVMEVEEAAKAAVEAVKALSVKVGIPQHLSELGIKEEDLPRLAASAIADVCTPGNPREVTEEIILELYKKAF